MCTNNLKRVPVQSNRKLLQLIISLSVGKNTALSVQDTKLNPAKPVAHLNIHNINYKKTTHKSNLKYTAFKNRNEKKCYREIVMVVLNLRSAANATVKSARERKSTAQTAQPI
jgi:hypothetical protein